MFFFFTLVFLSLPSFSLTSINISSGEDLKQCIMSSCPERQSKEAALALKSRAGIRLLDFLAG